MLSTYLSPEVLEFQPSQRQIRHDSEASTYPDADVSGTRHKRQRTRIPDLIHAQNGAEPAQLEAHEGGDAEGEVRLVFPLGPVETHAAGADAAEDQVLDQDDEDHELHPVAHQGQEDLHD